MEVDRSFLITECHLKEGNLVYVIVQAIPEALCRAGVGLKTEQARSWEILQKLNCIAPIVTSDLENDWTFFLKKPCDLTVRQSAAFYAGNPVRNESIGKTK